MKKQSPFFEGLVQGSFKKFLLNENQAYLGQKIGDLLTGAQDLRDEGKNMGARELVKFSEKLVSQIKRIIHSSWPKESRKYLKDLQKIGVAIMKGIEEKDDLYEIITASASELEKISAALGVPINKFGSPDASNDEPSQSVAEPEKEQKPPVQAPQAQEQPQDQPQDMAQPTEQ